MALIVESGLGDANSESYVSVADATTRHANLGNAAWAAAASDTVREQALRNATRYMVQAYRQRWVGNRVKVNPPQALDWPRYGVQVDGFPVHFDVVPADIANACADLALKALAGELAPDLTQLVTRQKVGPIETDYSLASPQFKRFRAIDMALAPYLTGSGAMSHLVRT